LPARRGADQHQRQRGGLGGEGDQVFRDVLAAEEPARVLLLEPGQAAVRGARPPAGQPPDPLQRGLPPRDPVLVGLAAHFENPDQLLRVGGQMAP
jgi:hypothetical protein